MQNICKNLLKARNPITIQQRPATTMAENTEFVISLQTPLADFKKLIKEKMQMDECVADEMLEENFKKISAAGRDTIWKLLFAEQPTKQENLQKAGDLMEQLKSDSCFYAPWLYNEWIKSVRDEVLKREMLSFWREQMVKRELGPCWARDSDYFDNLEDPEPEAFYKHAGCVAPFNKYAPFDAAVVAPDTTTSVAVVSPTAATTVASSAAAVPAKISLETPATDYTAKLQHQIDLDADDEEKLTELFAEAQQVIWQLLFSAATLSKENFDKSAALLDAYKRDACFYNPYIYNKWLPKLRDELFARKYFDFWKKSIIEAECGLCWYKDSDFFDDMEDTRPIEFLKSGDALMAEYAKV